MIDSECKTKAVHLYVKDNSFMYHEYVAPIHYPTQSAAIIAQAAYELFLLYYRWEKPVRALTITASKLQDEEAPDQLDMFGDYLIFDKRNRCIAMNWLRKTVSFFPVDLPVVYDILKLPR